MGLLRKLAKVFSTGGEQRRHARFAASNDTLVVLGPRINNHRKVQLIDISMGGLAFLYDGSVKDLKDSGILSLLAEDDIRIKDLHYDTVADYPLPKRRENEPDFRKRGVKFSWLGFLDKEDLEKFINDVSVGQM